MLENEKRRQAAAERFRLKVESEGYIQLSPYVNTHTKVRLMSPCGNEFEIRPSSFLRGGRYHPGKHGDLAKLYKDRFEAEGYKQLEPFKGSCTKIKLLSPCGNEFYIQPSNFLSGNRFDTRFHTNKAKTDFISSVEDREYAIVGPYVSETVKVLLLCPNGSFYSTKPSAFKTKAVGCPCCAISGYDSRKPGSFYLVRWTYNEDSFLKFGITTLGTDKRVKTQGRKTKYNPTILLDKVFNDGLQPVLIERNVKTNLQCNVVSKELFGDGFSETIEDTEHNIKYIEELIMEHIK